MKHKQPRRLFWERFIQEGTNKHRPAVAVLQKIIKHKKKIRQALGNGITQQDFSKIDKLAKAMSEQNAKFWRQLMDNEANAYLNALAMLEKVIENKKEIAGEIANAPTREQLARIETLVESMRGEIKEAAWISSRTKKTFKRALCNVMQNGIEGQTGELQEGPRKKKARKRPGPSETMAMF